MRMTNFADWQAICERKALYCRCLDTKDWPGFTDCFTEDYVLEVPGGGTHSGRDAVIRYVRGSVETSTTVHHVHNPEIRFDGPDAADVVWAMQDRNIWSEDRRRQLGYDSQTGFGHYHERYVRCADGEWRIERCRLSYLHMDRGSLSPMSGQAIPA